jgi:acyl-CoA hydrolase
MADLTPRRVKDSEVTLAILMLPADANPMGAIHGGVIMKHVDEAGGLAATRHCRAKTVTAHIDGMSFLAPVSIGDLVTFKASLNDVGRTSLEVGVRVEAEDLLTGKVRHISTAYIVYVALDEMGKPTPVPPLLAETEQEKKRQAAARVRREFRLRREEALRSSWESFGEER